MGLANPDGPSIFFNQHVPFDLFSHAFCFVPGSLKHPKVNSRCAVRTGSLVVISQYVPWLAHDAIRNVTPLEYKVVGNLALQTS